MNQPIDFHHIPTRQDGIHLRLEQWARWCMSHPTGGNVHPMFRMYQSKARQWEMPVIHAQASPKDNLEIERAVVWLPEKHRMAVRWGYCFPWTPVGAVLREIGTNRPGLAEMLVQARDMLITRLKMKMTEL